jgi:thiol-disulfide isomerase/thioredoxin
MFILNLDSHILLCANSCKNNDNKINDKNVSVYEAKINNNNNNNNIITDSITINILVPANQFLLLNVRNKYLQNDALYFKNPSIKDSIITKTIFREHDKQVLRFGMVVMDKGKIQNHFKHFYLIDEKLNNLNLKFKKNKDLELLDKDKSIIVDEIHKKYDSLKLFLNKTKNKDTLNRVYRLFKEKFKKEDKAHFPELNKIFYMSLLKDLSNNKVEHYIENIDNPIVSNPLQSLFYSYIKKNISIFDYAKLNVNNKSAEFLKYLSISIFNIIKLEDNKGDKKYHAAISWLKTTDFYKKDSIFIKKQITPLSNSEFKNKLKKIQFQNTNLKISSVSEIISENPSNYYLIDFWATWCAPCIQGVKQMNKIDFPKNIKIISVSLDKAKDKGKWKSKTIALKQELTYWLDEENAEAKSFLKFIELQSIPRYILIDNNLNIIDEAFYHPSEIQFLSKLKDVQNHKYW